MTSGIWFVLVIPAVLSFVFSVWVTIDIMAYIAERGTPQLAVREQQGQGVFKLKVPSSLNGGNNP